MFHFASPSIILVFHEKFEKEFSCGGGSKQNSISCDYFYLPYFKGCDLLAIVF